MILLLELLVVKCVYVASYICMIIGQEKIWNLQQEARSMSFNFYKST